MSFKPTPVTQSTGKQISSKILVKKENLVYETAPLQIWVILHKLEWDGYAKNFSFPILTQIKNGQGLMGNAHWDRPFERKHATKLPLTANDDPGFYAALNKFFKAGGYKGSSISSILNELPVNIIDNHGNITALKSDKYKKQFLFYSTPLKNAGFGPQQKTIWKDDDKLKALFETFLISYYSELTSNHTSIIRSIEEVIKTEELQMARSKKYICKDLSLMKDGLNYLNKKFKKFLDNVEADNFFANSNEEPSDEAEQDIDIDTL